MRYDEFRDRLQDALRETGLLFKQAGRLAENIDLAGAGRHWEIYLLHSPARDPAPFDVSARVAFAWDPVNAARAYTCEEDLLTAVLGSKQRYPKTQPRWTRVDLGLYATLPYGSTTPMPDSQLFGPWISSIGETLDKLLTEFKEREGRIVAITGGREDVAVEARGADGVLFLKGVSVSGFRIVRIPRVWDDPVRREAEKDIGKELSSPGASRAPSTNGARALPISPDGFATHPLRRGRHRPSPGSRTKTKTPKRFTDTCESDRSTSCWLPPPYASRSRIYCAWSGGLRAFICIRAWSSSLSPQNALFSLTIQ